MSTDDVKRWWVYDRLDKLGASIAPFENRREPLGSGDADSKYFKPKFSDVFEGPSTEIEVMAVADHDAAMLDLQIVIDGLTEQAAKNDAYYEFEKKRLSDLIAARDRRIEELEGELTSRSETARQTREDWLEAREHIQTLKTINESLNGNLAEARKEIAELKADFTCVDKAYADRLEALCRKLESQRNELILNTERWPTTDAIADHYNAELAAIAEGGAK